MKSALYNGGNGFDCKNGLEGVLCTAHRMPAVTEYGAVLHSNTGFAHGWPACSECVAQMKQYGRVFAAGGWQPIETAPKNHGREILVCEAGRTSAVVMWLDQANVMFGEEEGFVSGWYISDGHNDPIWYRNWPSLTHWLPMPTLPPS